MAFSENTQKKIIKAAKQENIDPAWVMAVAHIESAGKAFAHVNGKLLPLIRWEGHYFDRLLRENKRAQARAAGLASPRAQAVKNPRTQTARYALLERAMKIDEAAAIQSCSWGVFQVMGAHWKFLNFRSPQHLKETATRGIEGQVDLGIRFIKKNKLDRFIKSRDFVAFSRAYNGPAFRKNNYHTKLERWYNYYGGNGTQNNSTYLRLGSKGVRVKELQELLNLASKDVYWHRIETDGDFGPLTEAAVENFQTHKLITVDGVAGPQTMEKLATYANNSTAGSNTPIAQDPDVGVGVGVGVGGGGAILVAQETVKEVMGLEGLPTSVTTGLGLLVVALVIGGLAYALISNIRKNRTYHGSKII